MSAWTSASGTADPSGARAVEQRASTTSGPPLTMASSRCRPWNGTSWKVAMNLYSESNGTLATRG